MPFRSRAFPISCSIRARLTTSTVSAAPYPDIRLVYWAGGNPFHHHQDINRLMGALRRPETIIVNEIWWTPMARHADIVFPVTTPLERDDLSMCRWDPLIVAMRQAIPPVGGARSDYDVLAGIARAMGVEDEFTEGRSAEDWLRAHVDAGARAGERRRVLAARFRPFASKARSNGRRPSATAFCSRTSAPILRPSALDTERENRDFLGGDRRLRLCGHRRASGLDGALRVARR